MAQWVWEGLTQRRIQEGIKNFGTITYLNTPTTQFKQLSVSNDP